MNILITGGCGHIGSHLIRYKNNFNITVVDNMLTQRYCSLFNLSRNIKFKEIDIKDIQLKDLNDIDVVVHLAAITNATESFDNKDQMEEVNYSQTKDFIDLCEEAGCKFIFPSSTSVYGVAADMVYEDDDKFLNPQSPYATSKINIENYIKKTMSSYVILRFGTIFGQSIGMRFHTAINKFCYEISLGKPLTIWKENYEQVRPYLGLNDAVRSIIHFLNNLQCFNQTYNVISGNYKLSDVVKSIEMVAGEIDLNMVDTPLLNQFSYDVGDEKVRKTGFESKDKLEVSVRETLKLLDNLK
jgi:UDP-glucose 4-epimerase